MGNNEIMENQLTKKDLEDLRNKLANVSTLPKSDRQAQASKRRVIAYYVR